MIYEGILQGISTRILLYKLACNITFNNRAISTLAIESFFAVLSKAGFTMMGCPQATQIYRNLPIMMQYNSYKHDPEKKFCMDSRQGTPYPHYDLEARVTIPQPAQSDDIQFKSHSFDMFCKTTKTCFKVNLTVRGVHSTEHGKLMVRADNYKINLSKLSVAQKLNLPEDIKFELKQTISM